MSASDRDILALPSALVQTFPLETYLRSLSNHLADRLSQLDTGLSLLRGEVHSGADLTAKIRSFLRQQMMGAMLERAAVDAATETDKTSLELLLPEFLREDASSLLAVVDPVGCPPTGYGEGPKHTSSYLLFNGDSRDKRERKGRCQKMAAAEEEEKARAKGAEETYAKMEQMCKKVELTQRHQMEELQRILVWLRPAQSSEDDEEDQNDCTGYRSGRNSVESGFEGGGGSTADLRRRNDEAENQHELHSVICSAPLFVEFRKMLLRDVADRLADLQDQQSMALGSTTAALKRDVQRELNRVSGGGGGGDRGDLMDAGSHVGGTATALASQLRELDHNYMRRGDLLTSLREKADISLVAQKADDACVREMEKRLLDRIAHLEERVSLYEAERREFRNILRAVVDTRQQSGWCSNSVSGGGRAAGSEALSPVLSVVEETTDPRRVRVGDSSASHERKSLNHMPPSSSTRNGGAEKRSPPPAHRQAALERQQKRQSDKAEAGSLCSKLAIGLTVNQEAYANYVTRELNRCNIEALPPLPYERSRGTR